MTQVFISYKSEYRDFATRLRDQLRSWGFATWLDVDNIREGYYWRDEIDEGLNTSDVVVGIMTPEALASREVKAELDYAVTNQKQLLLLRYREVTLPYWLANLQYVDFMADEAQGFARLQKALTTPDSEPRRPMSPPLKVAVDPPTKTEQSNRETMLQKVHDYWIVGVLEKAEHNPLIDLTLAAPEKVLRHPDYGDYDLPTDADILTIYSARC